MARARAASKAVEKTLEFELERETKNTVRFSELGDDPVVGTLYVKKSAVAEMGNPESMEVVLRAK